MKFSRYFGIYVLTAIMAVGFPAMASGQPERILVVGDSLSAGYGVTPGKGWVDLLRAKLGDAAEVVNASVSGQTTRGGAALLPDALKRHQPDILILELGGNDGLRGISLEEMKSNLEKMVREAKETGARVLLVGVRIPPNYGPDYIARFEAVFRDIADEQNLAFVPRLLQGVADDFALMQDDGIHPTTEAQSKLLDNVWPALSEIVTR